MEYSKPKVTIDLEEYNELCKLKKDFKESDIAMYRVVLGLAFQSFPTQGSLTQFYEAAKNKGLLIKMIDNRHLHDGNMEITVNKIKP